MTNNIIFASNEDAIKAFDMVEKLQLEFVNGLNDLSNKYGENKEFKKVLWTRDNGLYGGGNRYEARDNILFNTGSVNISQVQYENENSKSLNSASAISTIIHPKNPNVPSVHIHISFTQLKDGTSYFRLMADLNPCIKNDENTISFTNALKNISPLQFEEAKNQGDKYFYIPALNKHRGVSHFYLENYKTENKEDDFLFAYEFGSSIIKEYLNIISNGFENRTTFSVDDIKAQLDYHTLYLFQVLTLDRGTTSGLLVHNQNDLGIMGSLPRFVNKTLLKSWIKNMNSPQDKLLESIIDCLDDNGLVDETTKLKLANSVREHYLKFPESLNMQASGNTIPKTVSNHKL